MKSLVASLMLIAFTLSANASGDNVSIGTESAEAYKNKVSLDAQFYLIKQAQQIEPKKSENALFNSLFIDMGTNNSCAEWVYRGSASREESVRACRGVHLLECVEWVYRGSASRVESAQACRGVTDMECVEFAYRGSASRVESAKACGDNYCN